MARMVVQRAGFSGMSGEEGWGSVIKVQTDDKNEVQKINRKTIDEDIKVAQHYVNFLAWQFREMGAKAPELKIREDAFVEYMREQAPRLGDVREKSGWHNLWNSLVSE